MYNPNKPEKYHIKTFGLCDSLTGYAYNLLIYFGAETSFDDIGDTGQSEKIFHSLLKPLGTGHHLFADQYYMTYKLIEYLIAKKTYCTGTLMANRKYFPNEIKSIKMRHMECAALVNQLLAEADTSKPLDHKQHKIAQPNIPVNSNQPSHLVKWVKNDRNCVVCSGPEEQIICVTLVMFIYMQKSALVHFILPEVRHLIFNRLHTSLLQKFYLLCTVVLGSEK